MPGILPMKVIKVGPSSQSRIAQACDRCRSKKIRCDGIRPCCSQCANVGFECKTSDKLSRRAFPRGYTESLEERVRALETEVRELKDLLDEKDEKIDMLSRMHSNRKPCTPSSSPSPPADNPIATPPKEDVFRIQASPLLVSGGKSDSYLMGASSGRAFLDAFKRRIQEDGKSTSGFNTEAFLNIASGDVASPIDALEPSPAPPHMFADRCVNVFFQEWAPLFPVLHKPTFLCMYEEYMSHPDRVTDHHKLAQLHLVFGIAGLSSDMPEHEQTAICENQWRSSLDVILMDNTLGTLQCLVLAMIHCISKADYGRLQHYKGIAIGLSHRLALHQSQKRFSFGALTIETRKKVFWTLYTLDCFSAALLGLPKLLKEEDIHTEYPSDTDDEYVTEKGFQPTLPGECTKISSALALFRVSRLLSKVLDQNYPSAAAHDLSMQSLASLETELNSWSDNLPAHLKLTFVLDKPSTDITGSRSALLSLAYYYIRTLIHRPAVGSSLGNKSSASVISLAESSKHIIQIVQLLEERSMSFSFCINKNEMLTLCGLSLLYHGLDLKQEGRLMQDGNRLVSVVIKYLETAKAPGAADFRRLAASMINLDTKPKPSNAMAAPSSTKSAAASLPATKSNTSPSGRHKQLQSQAHRHASASMSESDLLSQQEKLKRVTLPNVSSQPAENQSHHYGRDSMDSARSESAMDKRDYRGSVPQSRMILKPRSGKTSKLPNLDYLSLHTTPIQSQPQARPSQTTQVSHGSILPTSDYSGPKTTAEPTEWDVLLGSFDDRNLYDAIYGGPSSAHLSLGTSSSNYGSWSPESWDLTSAPVGDFMNAATSQSVLSLSDEGLSSSEEPLSASEMGQPDPEFAYKDDFLPGAGLLGEGYRYLYDGSDGTFGL